VACPAGPTGWAWLFPITFGSVRDFEDRPGRGRMVGAVRRDLADRLPGRGVEGTALVDDQFTKHMLGAIAASPALARLSHSS